MQQTLKENINCLTHANAGHCLKGLCVYQSHSTEVWYASANSIFVSSYKHQF